MMHIEIDEKYLSSVTIKHVYEEKDPTPERLLEIIQHGHNFSIESKDHPEFTKLREQLGVDGYIKIERGWWNGDIVLKPFTLNGFRFKKYSKFPSASAMANSMAVAKKYRRKSL